MEISPLEMGIKKSVGTDIDKSMKEGVGLVVNPLMDSYS